MTRKLKAAKNGLPHRKASGYSLIRPTRLNPADFKALILDKGWRMADVACRWGITPETLSRITGNPGREARWDDLVKSLPRISRSERAAATTARQALIPPKPRNKPRSKLPSLENRQHEEQSRIFVDPEDELDMPVRPNGLRYQGYVSIGDELAVIEDIFGFANEGDHLYVIAIELGAYQDGSIREDYVAESESGESMLLTPEDMDRWAVATGRSRTAGLGDI